MSKLAWFSMEDALAEFEIAQWSRWQSSSHPRVPSLRWRRRRTLAPS